jgi:hypothetical protein
MSPFHTLFKVHYNTCQGCVRLAKRKKPELMYVNKHCVFHCSKSKAIHGSTPVQIIIYLSITKGLCTLITQMNKNCEKNNST